MQIFVAVEEPTCLTRVLATLASWGHEVHPARNAQEAWKVLELETPPVIAIVDWRMLGGEASMFTRRLRDWGEPYVYTLIVGWPQERVDLATVRGAGGDFATARVDAGEILAFVFAARKASDLNRKLADVQASLAYLSTMDPLTGARNRPAIVNELEREMTRAERQDSPLSVVLFAVDGLKEINEAYGAQAGDGVLRAVVRRFRAGVRPYDTIGRYGENEFLLLMPGCNGLEAFAVAGRIRTALGKTNLDVTHRPCEELVDSPKPLEVRATISAGVAQALDSWDAEGLLRAAKETMQRAKRHGGNRVSVARLVAKPVAGAAAISLLGSRSPADARGGTQPQA